MHSKVPRVCAAFAFALPVATAIPLAAQQYSDQPARAQQETAPRGGRQSVPQVSNNQNPRGQSRQPQRAGAPVPRTAAQQPAGRGAQPGAAARRAPFTLTAVEQRLLDQILLKWERQSDRVKTFKCSFNCWEVNETFGPKQFDYVLTEGKGYIKFKAPDHGIYRVTELSEWDDQRKAHVARTSGLDHWVCNGKSIFEFNHQKRQLIERPLAPEMQGKAISEGPLPFIFGAKADQLKRRYWMRDITPANEINKKIRLEAWPKFQSDKANFHHAIVILNQRDFTPEALRIILPDGKNTPDYAFTGTQVNDPLSILKGDFLPPITPFGWKKVVETAQRSERVAPPGEQPAQARRVTPAPGK